MKTKIIRKAKEYVGTKFVHQGRVKYHGVDCLGLLICVGKELGIYDKDFLSYSYLPDTKVLLSTCRQELTEKSFEQVVSSDILLFEIAGSVQHFGIYEEENGEAFIIHAYASAGKVIRHRLDNAWKKRVKYVFSFSGEK